MLFPALTVGSAVKQATGIDFESRGAKDKKDMDAIKANLTRALQGDASALAELRRLSLNAATAARKGWALAAVRTAESKGAIPFPYANFVPPTETEIQRAVRTVTGDAVEAAAPAITAATDAATKNVQRNALIAGAFAVLLLGGAVYLVRQKRGR